ncbi:phage tail protein [Citrobacter braakii]|uniref:phage tail protein n=2 Tax=Citrobacter TaxID=544 RepID=UPI0024336F82|nr:phage tail protein [Citrobacter braakii]WFX65990.1 phage tail protein [Citrobacter braakii]
MSAKFYTLLTDIGAAKLASAAALGIPLKITHMAVGDGGGALPTPSAQQTALVAEKRRAALNMLYIDPQNSSQIIAEQVIPETEGGWWIREVGLFDENGALIAVGNCPESYKPQLVEGSGRTQTVRMVLITSSTDNITLKIDPAVVLATRKYVDDKVLELKVYVDDLMAKHLAAADPHTQYAPKASPTFTGTPKAPTAAAGNNSTQLANTAFVQAAIAALVASSPAALDTLNELAAALGNDPNFATTMTNALAGKMDKAANGKDIADVSEFLKNLGLGETINKASGAMQKSANGSDISDISAFRNAIRLGTAATRDVGGDNASKLLDLDSFRSMMSGNGYIYIPSIATTGNPVKLMLQWGTVATQKGADAGYALPFAFPYAGLFATGNRGTSGYNAAMNVRIASRTHISVQNWAPSSEGTEDCCFIALGY